MANRVELKRRIESQLFNYELKELSPKKTKETEKENYANWEAECPVCKEMFTNRGKMNGCDHLLCFTCTLEWSKMTNSCPVCRKKFSLLYHVKLLLNGKRVTIKIVKTPNIEQKVEPTSHAELLSFYQDITTVRDELPFIDDTEDNKLTTFEDTLDKEEKLLRKRKEKKSTSPLEQEHTPFKKRKLDQQHHHRCSKREPKKKRAARKAIEDLQKKKRSFLRCLRTRTVKPSFTDTLSPEQS
eukprot:TRINITY_DN11275_c0_g1_i2.p1 TRINITY_DN11275_c0_g1~~TRINITY_DN11275_c0_g1_i2.p1  ORF type:complete len:272 (+),score=43.94 TRINITY_DN11275_c0_g1_i2:96-818(+)